MDDDEPLTWEQIMRLMMGWHVRSIRIEYPTDRDGIYLYFMEITDQWQRWYIPSSNFSTAKIKAILPSDVA